MDYGIVVSDDKRHDKPTVGGEALPYIFLPSRDLKVRGYNYSVHRVIRTEARDFGGQVALEIVVESHVRATLHRYRYPTQTREWDDTYSSSS